MVEMDSLQARVAALTADYIAKLPEHLALFQSLKNRSTSENDLNYIAEVRNLAHKLSGSAGSYGFSSLGEVATKLDVSSKAAMDNDDFSEEMFSILLQQLNDLISEIENTIESN